MIGSDALDRLRTHIETTYGRKLGLLHHISAGVRQRLGLFNRYGRVRWVEVRRIVFVCDGNICRSAYAAAHAASIGLPAASFGLRATADDAAYEPAIRAAARRAVDLHGHRATAVADHVAEPGDLLLAMEPRQARALERRFGRAAAVSLLGLWVQPERPHIEDPYGLSAGYFETCFSLIDAANVRLRSLVPESARSADD